MTESLSNQLQHLAKALTDTSKEVRIKAVIELGTIHDSESIRLLGSLKNDEKTIVRINAISELNHIGGEDIVQPLLEYLHDSENEVRMWAATVLGTNEYAVSSLLNIIYDKKQSDRIRSLAVWAMHMQEPDENILESVLFALNDNSAEVRQIAADSLGRMENSLAVPPLISALNDVDADVRWVSALALASLNDNRAVQPLINSLQDEDESVRQYVAMSLEYFEDPSIELPLIERLRDTSSRVRRATIVSLRSIGRETALKELEKLLYTNQDSEFREQIQLSIDKIRTRIDDK